MARSLRFIPSKAGDRARKYTIIIRIYSKSQKYISTKPSIENNTDLWALFSFPSTSGFSRAFILEIVFFLEFVVAYFPRFLRYFFARKGIKMSTKLQKYTGSRYEKINGARIMPKIKILSAQRPRYLPYLGLCATRFFIFSHLQPPFIFECKSNVFVTFVTWRLKIVQEP